MLAILAFLMLAIASLLAGGVISGVPAAALAYGGLALLALHVAIGGVISAGWWPWKRS